MIIDITIKSVEEQMKLGGTHSENYLVIQ